VVLATPRWKEVNHDPRPAGQKHDSEKQTQAEGWMCSSSGQALGPEFNIRTAPERGLVNAGRYLSGWGLRKSYVVPESCTRSLDACGCFNRQKQPV
jgi:hypothetical protein